MKRALIGIIGTLTLFGAATTGCDEGEPPVIIPKGTGDTLENPPAISGGTLAITRDGTLLVAADADLDQLHVVSAADEGELAVHQLEPGDEPGRVIEGADHVMYAALRRGGSIVRLDLASGELTRAPACPAPRGMAYDQANQELHVACAGGELVTLSADLELLRTMRLERDMRDILISGDKLVISKFKSAEVIVVDAEGNVIRRVKPHPFTSFEPRSFNPAVAWRIRQLPDGDVAIVHQRGVVDNVPIEGTDEFEGASPYGGGSCGGGIVHAAVTVFDPDTGDIRTDPAGGGIGTLTLPVDAAVSPDGRVAVVAAGSDRLFESGVDDLLFMDVGTNCFTGPTQRDIPFLGEPLAVVYAPSGELFVQTRQPAGIHRVSLGQPAFDPNTGLPVAVEPSATVAFEGPNRRHVGHALFHKAASPASPIACASCHPEGQEDGRVWNFEQIGSRRTQNIAGGVLDTLPLHWDGTLADVHDLMGEVFVDRMGGADLPADRHDELAQWVHHLPLIPNSEPVDPDAVARGEAIFHDDAVGCAGCHSGETTTNNATVAVGTGQALQVPSLRGIAHRAPFMHDGCAESLAQRFFSTGPCGGGDQHGVTSQLGTAQVADLIAYLETL